MLVLLEQHDRFLFGFYQQHLVQVLAAALFGFAVVIANVHRRGVVDLAELGPVLGILEVVNLHEVVACWGHFSRLR